MRYAVADMSDMSKRSNFSKPLIFDRDQLLSLIKKENLSSGFFDLPAEFTFTDEMLSEKSREKWLNKRDRKFKRIEPLITPVLIEKYLFGGGVGEEVKQLILTQDEAWTTTGAYYHALNRFIVLGQTKNALLPTGLKRTGSNYLEFDKPSDKVIKRGRGGKTNQHSLSQTRGVTKRDKKNIKRALAYFKQKGLKFSYRQIFYFYQERFETTEWIRPDQDGSNIATYIPFDVHDTISYGQFYYHAKRVLNHVDLMKLKVGDLGFHANHKAKQGSAWEGLVGATSRYEVDATVLDVYVRYPYDIKGRYSLGRPTLYVVIDVYSTMIVGFYLGFSGPNWEGAAAALVNACSDKVAFAKKYGLLIKTSDWPCHHVPEQITVDNGKEYPNAFIKSILKSMLGVEAFNFSAVYRGDAKGSVEGAFNALNAEFTHFLPGAIFKNKREDQHPSNAAFYDYDALVAKLIEHFIYINKSAKRTRKYSWQAARDGIDITPQAIFEHSLQTSMHGGRPTTPEDEGRVWWAFLPEQMATVRDTCLYFNGLEYHSDYASTQGWFQMAKFNGRFKVPVKALKSTTNIIWHKTDDGKFIEFHLKNVNNESAFIDQPWEIVEHLLYSLKVKEHDLEDKNRYRRAEKRNNLAVIDAQMEAQLELSKPNERKSMQPNIKQRQAVQQDINGQDMANDVSQKLGPEQPPQTDTQDEYLDLDDLY
jgi:hypothetical protein